MKPIEIPAWHMRPEKQRKEGKSMQMHQLDVRARRMIQVLREMIDNSAVAIEGDKIKRR